MLFKYFRPKNSRKNLRFKKKFFRRKLSKIAENMYVMIVTSTPGWKHCHLNAKISMQRFLCKIFLCKRFLCKIFLCKDFYTKDFYAKISMQKISMQKISMQKISMQRDLCKDFYAKIRLENLFHGWTLFWPIGHGQLRWRRLSQFKLQTSHYKAGWPDWANFSPAVFWKLPK
jgi:hypothetical protein